MAPAKRIPPEQWESHKSTIHRLYIEEEKTLKEVIEALATDHGFHASEAQYVRKITQQWKLKKNSTAEAWSSAAKLIRKRKLAGKETDVFMNERKVTKKKLKKALSRKGFPTRSGSEQTELNCQDAALGLSVHTPTFQEITPIYKHSLPWSRFLTFIESNMTNSVFDTIDVFPRLPPFSDNLRSPLNSLDTHPFQASGSWWFMDSPSEIDPYWSNPLQQTEQSVFYPNWATSTAVDPILTGLNDFHGSSQRARKILGQCFEECIDPDAPDYAVKISSALQDVLVERTDGEHTKNVQALFSASQFDVSYQLLRYVAYLSSNNFLSSDTTERLLTWTVETGAFAAIESLMDSHLPTMKVFGGNLLVAAANMEDVDSVRALLGKGVDPNFLNEDYASETALHKAARHQNASLVEMLLNKGADPNIRGKNFFQATPLEVAIQNIEAERSHIPLTMLRMGADATLLTPSLHAPAVLTMAVENGSLELCQALLRAGACPNGFRRLRGNTYSPLQMAVLQRDLEKARILVAAGADVNLPAYEKWAEEGEAKRVMELHEFRTPLNIAIGNADVDMVRFLCEAGAHINGSPMIEPLPWQKRSQSELRRTHDGMPSDSDDSLAQVNAWRSAEDWKVYFSIVRTPLQEAIHHGNYAIARLLIHQGAEVNSAEGFRTPLALAAAVTPGDKEETRLSLICLLMAKGADVNSPALAPYSRTALQAAAEAGNQKMVELLLEMGANANAPPCFVGGVTALQAAVKIGNINIVRRLIESGADIDTSATTCDCIICLGEACAGGNLEMVNLFLQVGAIVEGPPSLLQPGCTALEIAVGRGDITTLAKLVENGARLDTYPRQRRPLLAIALWGKRLMAETLLSMGASPCGVPGFATPLAAAFGTNQLDMALCLIQAGADVNELSEGRHPTDFIEGENYSTSIQALLNIGVKVEGDFGASAVRNAIYYECPETLAALLDAGAIPDKSPPGFKDVPLQVAQKWGCDWAMHLLLRAGADVNAPATTILRTVLQLAAEQGDEKWVRAFLDAGANVNAPPCEYRGVTALQGAVRAGSIALVRLLLSRGADVNAPASAKYGATALQQAAITGNLPIALLLLEHGADVNAPPSPVGGRTALEAAAEHGRLDMMYLLLENDKSPKTFDARRRSAMQMAEGSGHTVLVKVLRDWGK